LAERSQNNLLRFIVRVPLTSALIFSGRLREGVAFSEEAEVLGGDNPALEKEPGPSPYGLLLINRARLLGYGGRLPEAEQLVERAVELGRARRDEDVLAGGSWDCGALVRDHGRLQAGARPCAASDRSRRPSRRRCIRSDACVRPPGSSLFVRRPVARGH